MALFAQLVDPRDVSWEVDRPTFRVHRWRRARPEDASPEHRLMRLRSSEAGWQCSEWELTGADVGEALTWAEEHAAGGDVADVWVVVPHQGDGRGKGLVCLRGYDPNETPATD